MTAHIAIVPAALAFASALFGWFYTLVRDGRQMTIVTFIVGLIVIETALYETITVPVGIFHLSSGSFQVRTIDIIIVIALVANALGSRAHQGLTFTALAWITFSGRAAPPALRARTPRWCT